MKKFTSMLLVMLLVLSMSACGGSTSSGEEKDVTLVLGNMAYGQENPYNIVCKKAAEILEEMGSSVHLDLQLEGVLGTERELIENCIMGNVDIVQGADMSFTPFAPQMAFVNFPLLLEDYDDVYEHWAPDGWIFQEADKYLKEAGLTLLGASDNGFRWITNSKRPIEKLGDIAGLKIRVPEVENLIDIWDKFGAVTAPISYTELTTALQQGVVDGQELGMQHYYTCGWYEYNKYATKIDYNYSAVICTINTETLGSLSEQQQADLQKAFAEANEYGLDYAVKFIEEGFDKCENEYGVQILERTPEMYDGIYNVGVELATNDKWMKVFGKDLVEKMYPDAFK